MTANMPNVRGGRLESCYRVSPLPFRTSLVSMKTGHIGRPAVPCAGLIALPATVPLLARISHTHGPKCTPGNRNLLTRKTVTGEARIPIDLTACRIGSSDFQLVAVKKRLVSRSHRYATIQMVPPIREHRPLASCCVNAARRGNPNSPDVVPARERRPLASSPGGGRHRCAKRSERRVPRTRPDDAERRGSGREANHP